VDERAFRTSTDRPVTAVTVDEMREVDEVTVEELGVSLLQLMESAGRTLAAVDAALVFADIGVPAGVYESLGVPYDSPFDEYWVRLRRES